MKLKALLLSVILATAGAFVGLWTTAPAAQACTCEAKTVADLAEESLLIVSATITDSRGSGPDTWYTAGIGTTWKGSAGLTVEFQPGNPCGITEYEMGDDELLFLRGVEGGPYYSYICGFSQSDDEVIDELQALGHQGEVLSPPVAEGSGEPRVSVAPATPESSTATSTSEEEDDPTAVPVWVYAPLAFGIVLTVVLVALFSRKRG